MEKKMRDYILADLEEYNNNVMILDEENLTNDILKSFKEAKSYKHYVMLIPSDMDEYYDTEEHNSFKKYGYYQLMIENRYGNRFFIPKPTIETVCNILQNENMMVEPVTHKNLPVQIYLVTLNGRNSSAFDVDFEDQNINNPQ
jgi:hypothetical protein